MAASYTYTCYLVDTSPSMGRPLDPDDPTGRTRLDYALEFVRIKLAQRLINPKKTDQIAVVTFGGATENQLAGDRDGYDHIEEVLTMRQPSYADLRVLQGIELGKHSVDLIAAIYVAGNLVRNTTVRRKDSKKNVILLTDADEVHAGKKSSGKVTVSTDWDDENWVEPLYNAIMPRRVGGGPSNWKELFSVGVIGMDFGDPETEEMYSSSWSAEKRANVKGLTDLVAKINQISEEYSVGARALFGSVQAAIEGAAAPSIAPISTVHKTVEFIIGDKDTHPDESLVFRVEVQKATQKAAVKSMSKMRRGAWTKSLNDEKTSTGSKKRRRGADDDDEEEEEDVGDEHDRDTMHDPGAVVTEKQYYYVPDFSKEDAKEKPKKPDDDAEPEDVETEAEKFRKSEASRKLETEEYLSRAYKYGADLLPLSKEEEADFYQFPAGEACAQLRGFMYARQYRPEWALGDPRWMFAAPDNESQLQFSAMLWALKETKSFALIRLLLPKESQPRLYVLAPLVGDTALEQIAEAGLLLAMPFKEEVANWAFPSLERILTVNGRPVTEHRLLPKEDLLTAMDHFVDSMMLPLYVEDDEAEGSGPGTSAPNSSEAPLGAGTPWFDPAESYNPAIHNMRNCIIHKLLHPDANLVEDMIHHPLLLRYLFPPEETMEASSSAAMSLQKAAKLTLVPPKPKMTRGRGRRKQGQKPSTNALDDILGEGAAEDEDDDATQQAGMQSQSLYQRPGASFRQSQHQAPASPPAKKLSHPANMERKARAKGKGKAEADDSDSATEDSDADRTDGIDVDQTDEDVDENKPKRTNEETATSLLSEEDPLREFEQLIKQSGLITKAVKQLLEMIELFIERAKQDEDYEKPLTCLTRAREVAIEDDEVDAYNAFLQKIRGSLVKARGHKQKFFKRLQEEKLGLITTNEGDDDLSSRVDLEEADEFWHA